MLFLLKQTTQFQHIEDDNSGIIFEPYQKINILQDILKITYSIDISVIEELKNSSISMVIDCPNESHLTSRIRASLPSNKTTWYRQFNYKPIKSEPEIFIA